MNATGLSRMQISIMAVSAGICVANIYYNQPILKEIAASFHASESEAGSMSVLSQAGYGLGLFFLTPLGDKVKLILALQGMLLIALAGITQATQLWGVLAMSLIIGITGVAARSALSSPAYWLASLQQGCSAATSRYGLAGDMCTASREFLSYLAW